MQIVLHWLLTAVAILIAAYVLPGAHVDGFIPALMPLLCLPCERAVETGARHPDAAHHHRHARAFLAGDQRAAHSARLSRWRQDSSSMASFGRCFSASFFRL
ncbi:MAG: hypothetical protein HW416_596 [Chloroflexi bacterium]|nr:hypothetical protein [Chloroflexota bacterium]